MLSPFRTWAERASTAWKVGWRAFVSTYRAEDFVAESDYGWDDYSARLARYNYNRFYVHNTIYSELNTSIAAYRKSQNLYKLTRGLRNPVSRLVRIERAKTLGGFINYETFADGALPIKGADDTLLESIRTLWQWSNMDSFKNLLIYNGASMGDSAIIVVDDMQRQKVYLEVLDPRKVKSVKFDNLGNVKEILISYQRYDNIKNTWYEFSLWITNELFATYYNEQPYAYVEDEAGRKVASWPNPYGFVPVEWIKHQDVGQAFGATSFHDTRTKIDNLNDVISLVHDAIRVAVKPKLIMTGKNPRRNAAGGLETMTLGADARDQAPVLYLGEDGQINPLGSDLDIDGAMLAVNAMVAEVEADLPQLTLSRLQDKSTDMSGTAIEDLAGDGIDIINSLQSTYLSAIASASKMGMSIAALRRYDGFRAFNLDSYGRGDLDFDIRPQPVFQDEIRKEKRIELALQAVDSSGASVILPELGWTDEQVKGLQAEKEKRIAKESRNAILSQANAIRQSARANGANGNGTQPQAVVIDNENPPAL